MAGDWIPWDKGLTRKPEVLRVARVTGLSPREVAATLMDFWSWADDHSTDGVLRGMDVPTLSLILSPFCPDRVPIASPCAGDSPGTGAGQIPETFWDELARVGWLRVEPDRVVIPNFDVWMHHSAKRRLKETRKKRRQRRHPKPCPDGVPRSVPIVSRCAGDRTGTERGQNGGLQDRTGQDILGDESPNTPLAPSPPAAGNGAAAPPPAEPPILTFPTVGSGPAEWGLTAAKLAEYREAFPGVDALAECRKALQWCRDNPARRKTARGMPAFLGKWLERAQNGPARPAAAGGGPAGRVAPENLGEQIARARREAECRTRTHTTSGPSGTPGSSGSPRPPT